MRDFKTVNKIREYNTAHDQTKAPAGTLVSGSQNVLIDTRKGKVYSRGGYSRLGVANTALTPVRGSTTWDTSTATSLMVKQYDDELEVYLGTVDGTDLNAWYRVANGFSTTEIMRFCTWWNNTESLDVLLFVIGNNNLYKWNGAVAVASTTTSNTITKAGTSTFGQSRFYTVGNKVLINVRTGTEFTYTGGEGTTQLTGVTPDPTSDIVVGDVLVQKVVTTADKPAANRNNHTIDMFQNQIFVGSEDDNEVYVSDASDYTDFGFSTRRVAGEGALFTLDGICTGFAAVGGIMTLFAGKSSIFRAEYQEVAVGTSLVETLKVKKIYTGANQGSFGPDTVISLGNEAIYLSNEPALRSFSDPQELEGLKPKTLSNPIKPDFDAETWTNAHLLWDKNRIYLTSPVNSRLYILEFVEDSDGNLIRFWHPPQILPVRRLSTFNNLLYGHSNSTPESYQIFSGNSDINSEDEKLPINAIAKFSYLDYDKYGVLKNFDEFYVDGEISPSTDDLLMTINYGYGGFIKSLDRTIDGTDLGLLQETLVNTSLAQQLLAQHPLGGLSVIPEETASFSVIFEIAKEDFDQIQVVFSSNELDRYWAISTYGPNVKISTRQPINIKR